MFWVSNNLFCGRNPIYLGVFFNLIGGQKKVYLGVLTNLFGVIAFLIWSEQFGNNVIYLRVPKNPPLKIMHLTKC